MKKYLQCDRCGERYPDELVYMNDEGISRCAYCLYGLPHPCEEEEINKRESA